MAVRSITQKEEDNEKLKPANESEKRWIDFECQYLTLEKWKARELSVREMTTQAYFSKMYAPFNFEISYFMIKYSKTMTNTTKPASMNMCLLDVAPSIVEILLIEVPSMANVESKPESIPSSI